MQLIIYNIPSESIINIQDGVDKNSAEAIFTRFVELKGLDPVDHDYLLENISGSMCGFMHKYKVVGGKVVPVPETIEDVMAKVKAEVGSTYNSIVEGKSRSGGRIYVDCVVGETTYRMDAGEKSASRMDGGVRMAQEVGETTIIVRDYNNKDHYLHIDDAKQIRDQQAIDARRYWRRKCELNAQVESAQSVSELRAIDLSFGENVG